MCFFKQPKIPKVETPPVVEAPKLPPPPPIVSPSEVSPLSKEENRRKRINKLRSGIASTIKTGPRGTSGAGADLKASTLFGKQKLGA